MLLFSLDYVSNYAVVLTIIIDEFLTDTAVTISYSMSCMF